MSESSTPLAGASGSAPPPGALRLLHAMRSGRLRLFWGNLGPWCEVDGHTRRVHIASARALGRRGLIVRGGGLEYVASPNATGSATEAGR